MQDTKNLDLRKILKDPDLAEILGILVHELKTGISVIMGNSSLLEFENRQLAGSRRIRDIELFCRYLSGVLEGFHLISRMSRGYEEQKHTVVLGGIIEDVKKLMSTLSSESKVIHEIVQSQEVEGSEVLWRELIFGLVMNGICHGRGDIIIKEGDKDSILVVENHSGLKESQNLMNEQQSLTLDRGLTISKLLAGALGREINWQSINSDKNESNIVRVRVS